MTGFTTIPNPDLTVRTAERAVWNSPDTRRFGFHNLHRISRHGVRLRARNVLPLTKDFDMRIEAMPAVLRLTRTSMFSAMAVVRDARLLYERYAADFGPERPHAIMSISKTMMHLIYGQLVDAGRVDLNAPVETYLPEIGSGYARASVRDVLDMNVANNYSEDYSDPHTSALEQEVSMGWRVPGPRRARDLESGLLVRYRERRHREPEQRNRLQVGEHRCPRVDRGAGERSTNLRPPGRDRRGGGTGRLVVCVSTDRGGTPILNGGLLVDGAGSRSLRGTLRPERGRSGRSGSGQSRVPARCDRKSGEASRPTSGLAALSRPVDRHRPLGRSRRLCRSVSTREPRHPSVSGLLQRGRNPVGVG